MKIQPPESQRPRFDQDRQPLLENPASSKPSNKSRLSGLLHKISSTLSQKIGRSGHYTVNIPETAAPRLNQLKPAPAQPAVTVKTPPPTSVPERVQLSIDAQVAAFPYHNSVENIHGAATNRLQPDTDFSAKAQWSPDLTLGKELATKANFAFKEDTGLIYDQKSGLTAYVMKNPETQELRLVFGGTTSGKKAGGMNKRMLFNAKFTLKQWIANGKNAVLGKTPDSYRQARVLTDNLLAAIKAPNSGVQDYTLKLSGHSKGAGEATYAALAREQPIPAICFGSAQLGSGLQKEIPATSQALATDYVSHYNIKGDIVPKLGNLRNGLGHLGKVTTLPSAHIWNSPIHRHDQFASHINDFANSQQSQ